MASGPSISAARTALLYDMNKAAQKAKKAMEQVHVLDRKLEAVAVRYRCARRHNMKLWRYKLRMRLVTTENIRGSYLDYVEKQLKEYRRLRLFDDFYYASDSDDTDSDDTSSDGHEDVPMVPTEEVDPVPDQLSERSDGPEDSDGDVSGELSYDSQGEMEVVFLHESEDVPNVMMIGDQDEQDLFPEIFTQRDVERFRAGHQG